MKLFKMTQRNIREQNNGYRLVLPHSKGRKDIPNQEKG
jgi:hypothetical protein